jgi:hypothetical protein
VSFATVAFVPVHVFASPDTPLQHITEFAYPAVDWLGSSVWALLAPDSLSAMTLGDVHAAAVVTEHESVPARTGKE